MIKYILPSIILLIVSGSVFYWFQVRPAQIKHDCSWVKTHFDKIPAKSGKTVEQVSAESKLSKEDQERAIKLAKGEVQPRSDNSAGPDLLKLQDSMLELEGESMISKMQGSPEVPARDEIKKATPTEYTFCLHEKGL